MNLVAWNIVVGLVALVATVATGYRCWRYRRMLERRLEAAPQPPRAEAAAPASPGVLGVLPLAVGLLAALALVAVAASVFAAADRFFTPGSAVTALLGVIGGLLLLLAVEPVTALLVVARAYPWNDPERAGRAQAGVARRRWMLELVLLVAASCLVAVTGTRFGVLGVPSGAGEAAVELGRWSGPLTMLWLVAATLVTRLLDGLEGAVNVLLLVAGVAVFFFTLGASEHVLNAVAVGLVCASLGSLRFNLFPARLSLRGAGMLVPGFMFAVLTVMARQKTVAALLLVFPLAVLVVLVGGAMLGLLERTMLPEGRGGRPGEAGKGRDTDPEG